MPTCTTAFSDPTGNLWVFGFEQALCFPAGGGAGVELPSFGLGPAICSPDIGADGYLAGVIQALYSTPVVTLAGGAGGAWQPLNMPTGLAGLTAGKNVTEVVTALDSIGMWRALCKTAP